MLRHSLLMLTCALLCGGRSLPPEDRTRETDFEDLIAEADDSNYQYEYVEKISPDLSRLVETILPDSLIHKPTTAAKVTTTTTTSAQPVTAKNKTAPTTRPTRRPGMPARYKSKTTCPPSFNFYSFYQCSDYVCDIAPAADTKPSLLVIIGSALLLVYLAGNVVVD